MSNPNPTGAATPTANHTDAHPELDQPAWALLERAIIERASVTARYHDTERVLCPHALGWKHRRAKLVAYQSAPATADTDPPQQWRSMFVDQLEQLRFSDQPWQSADNYTPNCNNIDQLAIDVHTTTNPLRH